MENSIITESRDVMSAGRVAPLKASRRASSEGLMSKLFTLALSAIILALFASGRVEAQCPEPESWPDVPYMSREMWVEWPEGSDCEVKVWYCYRSVSGGYEILFQQAGFILVSNCVGVSITPEDYVAITDKAFENIISNGILGDIPSCPESSATIYRVGRPSCISDPYHWINWPTNDNVTYGVRPCANNPLNICWMISTYCWNYGEDGTTPILVKLSETQDPMSSSLCPDKFMPTDIYPGSTDGPIINCNPICE
jgi:hypothetical protein